MVSIHPQRDDARALSNVSQPVFVIVTQSHRDNAYEEKIMKPVEQR